MLSHFKVEKRLELEKKKGKAYSYLPYHVPYLSMSIFGSSRNACIDVYFEKQINK
jgi:hypothetical protein